MTPNKDMTELLELAEAFCLDVLSDAQKSRLEQLTTSDADLRRAGIDEIAFYNYGHLREASLEWIGAAMAH